MTDACLLSCDWGSTSFRLRAVTGAGEIRAERRSPHGTSAVGVPGLSVAERDRRFAAVLVAEIAALEEATGEVLAGLPVVVSGMATSAHGWVELPYAVAPLPLDGKGLVTAQRSVCGHEVTLVSGIRTVRDVMRGEECELLGLLRSQPAYGKGAVLVLLPGTHAKHVRLHDGRLVDFRTAMSGELFGLLKEHSVLRHSFVVTKQGLASADSFLAGLREVASGGLVAALFQVRVRTLLAGASAADSAAFLDGLLLGDELRGLDLAPGQRVLVGATGTRGEHYRLALAELYPQACVSSLAETELDRLPVLGHLAVLAAVGKGDQ